MLWWCRRYAGAERLEPFAVLDLDAPPHHPRQAAAEDFAEDVERLPFPGEQSSHTIPAVDRARTRSLRKKTRGRSQPLAQDFHGSTASPASCPSRRRRHPRGQRHEQEPESAWTWARTSGAGNEVLRGSRIGLHRLPAAAKTASARELLFLQPVGRIDWILVEDPARSTTRGAP